MWRLLGMLRAADERAGLAPQPGVERLDDLIDGVRRAGVAVDLEVEGAATALPPGIDVSAYRIVQEALTNTIKHAGPRTPRSASATCPTRSRSRSTTTDPATAMATAPVTVSSACASVSPCTADSSRRAPGRRAGSGSVRACRSRRRGGERHPRPAR
jgi:hypothetical protein